MAIVYQFNPIEAITAEIDFNTADIASGISIGYLPANSEIVYGEIDINTVFNAGTSNTFTIGSTATGTQFATNATVAPAVAGIKRLPLTYGGTSVSARTVYARYTQTGTAATTGKAYITMWFRRVAGNIAA